MNVSKRKSESSLNKRHKRPCSLCGYAFDKERMRCPSCSTWNTGGAVDPSQDQTVLLGDAIVAPLVPIVTGPWDPCFGQQREANGSVLCGLIETGVTLLGGAPGAGKSTLALQLAMAIACSAERVAREVLYIEAEESTEELKARAVRLLIPQEVLNRIRVVPMGSSADLATTLLGRKPSAIVIDSLQGLCGGDLEAQVEFCKALKDYTVPLRAPAIVISHVTKDEGFAGLMALQHAVDTTVLFTVYDDGPRELKTMKNRFGPSNVELLFNMTETGLVLRLPSEDEEDEDEDD